MTSKYFTGEDLEARIKHLEEDMATIKGDTTLANLPSGTLKEAASMLSVRRVGRFYYGGVAGAAIPTWFGNSIMFSGNLFAVPFYMPGVPNRVTKIGVYAGSGATGAKVRLGIYDDVGGSSPVKPHKLLIDAGEADVSAGGDKVLDVMQDFPRGLKWLVCVSNNSTPQFRVITEGTWGILGEPGMTGQFIANYWSYNQGYGALPDPFPAAATVQYGSIFVIGVMFG
jgi:hypothetical protein